jgi:hypothetical protein
VSEQDQKAGTDRPDDTGDDAAAAALAESVAAADRDAESEGQDKERTDWKALALTYKGKAESHNKLEEEVQELRARLESKPSPTDDQKGQREDAELHELMQDLAEAEKQYRTTKDVAYKLSANSVRLQLIDRQERAIERREEKQERGDRDYLLNAVEADEDGEETPLSPKRREELRAFYKKNRDHFASIEAAHDGLIGREHRQTRAQLAKEKKNLRREEDRSSETVIRTGTRDVSAAEARGRSMTFDQYQAKLAKLEHSDPDAAWKLKQDVMHDRVHIT